MVDSPVEHGEVFLAAGGLEKAHAGDVGDHGHVEKSQVCGVGHAPHAAVEDVEYGVAVDAAVLRELVVGALKEGGAHAEYGPRAALGQARAHAHCLLLGDADVDKLPPGALAACGREAYGAGGAGGDGDHGGVGCHALYHVLGKDVGIALGGGGGVAGGAVKGAAVVEALLIALGRGVSLAFHGVEVHHDRSPGVFDILKCLDERGQVVAVGHVHVVVSERAEDVARGGAVALAQGAQVVVEAAVVGGDRHLVVVDHHDEVGVQLGGVVERLKCLAAAERAVADDGHHALVAAAQVAGQRQARGQTHRGGRVADGEEVVWALGRIGVAGDLGVARRVGKGGDAAGEHLVDVCLVGYVEDYLVARRVKYVVERHGGLEEAQVGAGVAAAGREFAQEYVAQLGAERAQLGNRQRAYVGGRGDISSFHKSKNVIVRCKVAAGRPGCTARRRGADRPGGPGVR